MRMTRVVAISLLVVVAFVAGRAEAQVSIGAAQSLYIQPGARPAGMGDCFVAIADDATACYWNPAGLAYMRGDKNFTLMHSELVPDWGDVYYEYASFGWKVSGLGTLGFSVTYLTYGEQTATEETPDGGIVKGTFTSYEFIPSVAYGTTIGEDLALGLNLKFVYVDLAPREFALDDTEGTGVTFAGDIGMLYRVNGGRLTIGGAVQHIGPKIGFSDEPQKDNLPRNLKVGAAYRLIDDEMNLFLLTGEYNKSLVIYEDFFDQSTGVILNVGAEYRYYDLLSLRAGYVYDKDGDVKDLAYGFGVQYKDWAFDWASIPQAEGLTRPFRFSLSAFF